MSNATAIGERHATESALESLRKTGNPFRNYFARNPDDEVCARYHVPELFAVERGQLLGVVELYRADPTMHSEVVPVLGNKGSGKTHLLHSIKHGDDGAWQLLVTPGLYQKDSHFLEYLLFQVIDTLLGGGKQRALDPLRYIGETIARRLVADSLERLNPAQRLDLFPAPGLAKWTRRLGLGTTQAQERTQWLIDNLRAPHGPNASSLDLQNLCAQSGIESERVCQLVFDHVDRTEAHNTAGLMRRHLLQGFARAALLGDESDLANFLTFGFAELEFQVKPSREDLVMTLFKVLCGVFQELHVPVVVAFDQLEDLLLARRNDDGQRTAEAFFAGIVQAMHQLDGLCFLVFAERGLWNRFVPSLDGYIQDRLNNPIHLPDHGTLKTLRLEAPPPELVRRVVEARLRPALEECGAECSSIVPFTDEQIDRIARTEPTLRDMLQQFRHLFDHVVYGVTDDVDVGSRRRANDGEATTRRQVEPVMEPWPPQVKSVTIVESPEEAVQSAKAQAPESSPVVAAPRRRAVATEYQEAWERELRSARRQLEPDGAITGATRELQAGLGAFLDLCHDHGVKVGPWRLAHVVGEWTFGDHPTYGSVTIAHWACKDGQPWKVGIGLFLGRGAGKPKDLEIKLAAMEAQPPLIDHLILLRPDDDMTLTGKSKTVWADAQKRGRHARLEPATLDRLAVLYGFPRFLASVAETLPEGQPIPNLADFLQERCEKLLEQVCMPVQG